MMFLPLHAAPPARDRAKGPAALAAMGGRIATGCIAAALALTLSSCGILSGPTDEHQLRLPDDMFEMLPGDEAGPGIPVPVLGAQAADEPATPAVPSSAVAENPLKVRRTRSQAQQPPAIHPDREALHATEPILTNQVVQAARADPVVARADGEAQPANGTAVAGGADAAGSRGGTLRPGLEIRLIVVVTGKKEVDEASIRLADDGTVRLPLVGSVAAAGLTLGEFRDRLVKAYSEFLVDPEVVVDFVAGDAKLGVHPWGSVTVLGRVASPGRVSLPPTRDMTVIGAIQAAGGLAPSARDSSVRVTRRLPGGGTEIKDVDVRSVGSKGDVAEDMKLGDGDVIFVPEKMF